MTTRRALPFLLGLVVAGTAHASSAPALTQPQSLAIPFKQGEDSTPSDDAPTAAARPLDPSKPPTLTTLRYTEDWSTLSDPEKRTGRWTEKFKYIPLDGEGRSYLTTGLEVRLRSEVYGNNEWGDAAKPNDGYLLARALPYVDLHFGPARIFVQPIMAYAASVEPSPSPLDQTRTDFLQAFADVKFHLNDDISFRLRAGREMMSLGTERLVGARYGVNVPLAFDGGRAVFHYNRGSLNLFYLIPVEPRAGSFDDRSSPNKRLWGGYFTHKFDQSMRTGVDFYYLGYRNSIAQFEQGTGRELRHTLGVRVFGKASSWSWNVEGMYQFGSFNGGEIRAWSIAVEGGKSFPNLPLTPAITVRLDAVSGDKNPNDNQLQSFNALFPKGKYFGELTPIGPRNIVNSYVSLGLDLGGDVSVGLATMAYWRESLGDGIYDVPGHLIRSHDSNARFVGKEAELTVSWLATPELELSASASVFAPGQFIRDTGSARPIHMLGLESSFRF